MYIKSAFPTSNHPNDFTTIEQYQANISWVLYDDYGGGKYRVFIDDTMGNMSLWINWTSWSSYTKLNVPINYSKLGIYDYTIEYYDNHNQFGMNDTVRINIVTEIPSEPIPIVTHKTIISSSNDDEGDGEAIPGYDLLILISIVAIITMLLIMKHFLSLKIPRLKFT